MKKLLLTFTIVLTLLQQGKSQVFAPVGAKWYLSQVNWFGPLPIVDTAYVSESMMDTIIDGINCRKVDIICLCCDAQDMYVYDSNDTVYRYNFDLNRFTVLFNFNLNAGDSMYVVMNGFSGADSILVHIDSADYININSQVRKIQYGASSSTANQFLGPFVQGVGSLSSITPQIGVCDPLSGPLRCYEDSVLGLYNTGYRSSCDSLYVVFDSVDEISKDETEAHIYPNPFNESAMLSFNIRNVKEGRLEIRNTFGKAVSVRKMSGNRVEIKRNNLPPGIYFYRIITDGNKIITGKFIIE